MIASRGLSQGKCACFINPFSNHSYFTVRALSSHSSVYLFCPPLQLQLFFRRWRRDDICLVAPSASARANNIFCIFAFLLYRLRIISHSGYIHLFRHLLCYYLESLGDCAIFAYYQDYISDVTAFFRPEAIRICELIIRSDPSQANFRSTISAIESASAVVMPNADLMQMPFTLNSPVFVAPYGGDKCQFYSNQLKDRLRFIREDNSYLSEVSFPLSSVRIVARAHSFRKGADVLLHALLLLQEMMHNNFPSLNIDVFICGSIKDPDIYSEYVTTSRLLSESGSIKIHCQQYEQYAFTQLLSNSHLFVMPSRLEGSSPAALEALWHGIPSILTPQCGVHEFIPSRHGRLLSVHEPLRLAEAIYAFLDDPTLFLYCRKCLQHDHAYFSWERYFQGYNQLLLQMCH